MFPVPFCLRRRMQQLQRLCNFSRSIARHLLLFFEEFQLEQEEEEEASAYFLSRWIVSFE